MAEQNSQVQSVGWGRLNDGRFFIEIALQIPQPGGKTVRVPMTSFILTKDEEERLKGTLTGLHIASSLSGPINGQKAH